MKIRYVFCNNCGRRIDELKPCPHCSSWDNIFADLQRNQTGEPADSEETEDTLP